jgi:hypothetical protein
VVVVIAMASRVAERLPAQRASIGHMKTKGGACNSPLFHLANPPLEGRFLPIAWLAHMSPFYLTRAPPQQESPMADLKSAISVNVSAPYEALAIRLLDLVILLVEKAPPDSVEKIWNGYVQRAEKLEEFWEKLSERFERKERG